MSLNRIPPRKPWYASAGFWLAVAAIFCLLCMCLAVIGGGIWYTANGRNTAPEPTRRPTRTPQPTYPPEPTAIPAATEAPFIPTPPGVTVFEDFTEAGLFSSTDKDLFISGGKAVWSVSRNGGAQFLYRTIPAFSGDASLTVIGRINTASNNCGGRIGIGDAPGSGISIQFGWFGGGCPQNGFMIDVGNGISLNHSMDGCSFIGTWLWVEGNTDHTVSLDTQDGYAILAVPGVGTVDGSVAYYGEYNTLWVGLEGDGDWPSCSGSFDSAFIQQLP